jgi:chromate transporter
MFLGRGCISTLLSFGGGDAYLAVADGLFVETGIVSSSAFYGDIVPVANILPGSILCKALTAIGYYYGISTTGSVAGGLVFALGGFAVSVSVSCMVFRIVYYLYEHLSGFRSMQTISHYIGPIICGLLGTVVLALLVLIKNALIF